MRYQGDTVYLEVLDESAGTTLNGEHTFTGGAYTGVGQIGIVNWYSNKDVEIDYLRWSPCENLPQPEAVTISVNKTTIAAGETLQALAIVTPEGADQTVTWSIQTDGESYGKVTEDGLITGIAEGSFTVVATAPNGVTAQQEIKVEGRMEYPLTVVGGSSDQIDGTAAVGDTVTITADDASQFSKWSCENPEVVFADANAVKTTFIMPADAVTVVANNAKNDTYRNDFDLDGAKFEITNLVGTYSGAVIEGGVLKLNELGTNRFLVKESPSLDNGVFEARFKGASVLSSFGFAVRTVNNTTDRLLVAYDAGAWKWYANGGNGVIVEAAAPGANEWYTLRVGCDGTDISLLLKDSNDKIVVSGSSVIPVENAYLGKGQIGIVNWGATKNVEVDYLSWGPFAEATDIQLNGLPSDTKMKVGENFSVTSKVLPETASQKVSLSIEQDENVAALNTDGVITALKEGAFTLVATSGNITKRVEITVKGVLEFPISVIGGTANPAVAADGTSVTITIDKTISSNFINWSCNDPAVVFADAKAAETTFVMPANAVTVVANYASPGDTTYYVDAENGDDSNSGISADAPWKTLDKVNSFVLAPGDKVLLKAGSVFVNQGLALNGGGSVEKPIVVSKYGDGALPVIQAGGVPETDCIISASGNNALTKHTVSYAIHLKNISYVTLKDLEITNNPLETELATGVFVEACGELVMRGIRIDGLYVHDVNGDPVAKAQPNGGIFFKTTVQSMDPNQVEENTKLATRFDGITIENCTVKDVARTGISVGSSHAGYWWYQVDGIIPEEWKAAHGHTNVLIQNNYVENAGGDSIVPQFCISPLVQYNISNGASQMSHTDRSQYNAGIWPWRCEDAVFQYNEAYGTVNNGDGQGYDCDFSRGTVYQYNYSHDNEGGFMLVCQSEALDSIIRYNISQSDGDSLFLVSNRDSADVYNNTFYIDDNLRCIAEGVGPATLKNNIFYNVGDSVRKNPKWGSNFTYDNNLYYGFDVLPQDKNAIEGDPLFYAPGTGGTGVEGNSAIDTLQGYILRANSPAIHAGVAIEDNITRDYAGNAIAEKPSLGALEYHLYNVTFNSQGGSIVSKQEINYGALVAEPKTPEKAGYVFDGWYQDAACTKAWDFGRDIVTDDITLYAKWIVDSESSSSSGSSSNSNGSSNTSNGESGNSNSIVSPITNAPKTGDNSPLWVLTVVLCLSIAGMLVMIIHKKRRNDE